MGCLSRSAKLATGVNGRDVGLKGHHNRHLKGYKHFGCLDVPLKHHRVILNQNTSPFSNCNKMMALKSTSLKNNGGLLQVDHEGSMDSLEYRHVPPRPVTIATKLLGQLMLHMLARFCNSPVLRKNHHPMETERNPSHGDHTPSQSEPWRRSTEREKEAGSTHVSAWTVDIHDLLGRTIWRWCDEVAGSPPFHHRPPSILVLAAIRAAEQPIVPVLCHRRRRAHPCCVGLCIYSSASALSPEFMASPWSPDVSIEVEEEEPMDEVEEGQGNWFSQKRCFVDDERDLRVMTEEEWREQLHREMAGRKVSREIGEVTITRFSEVA
uniref:Uncharacterized protein n=1 Tax=Leersia perrieri TaxID=77586 RepID=A0A0D9WQ02_9ORYZ